MALIERTINDITIKPVVPTGNEPDGSKIKGFDYFPTLYSNTFMCAKKKSGKTNVIMNVLPDIIDEDTMVFIFASTVFKDKTYGLMLKLLDDMEIEYEAYTSIHSDDGQENILEDIINGLKKKDKKKLGSDLRDRTPFLPRFGQEKKPRKKKLSATKILFIFDDLGQTLRDGSMCQLLKTNRHFECKVIASSQSLTDLHPMGIQQLDYVLIFKGMSVKKLEDMHKLLDLQLNFDKFHKLYKYATSEKFHFLYVDVRNELFRKNFNVAIGYDGSEDSE